MIFFKEKFNIFADLGDLSKYSLEELKDQVSGSFHFEVELHNDINIVKWEDCKYRLIMHYTPQGKFIKIFSETWKNTNQTFTRK